jgi:hypothetical protein
MATPADPAVIAPLRDKQVTANTERAPRTSNRSSSHLLHIHNLGNGGQHAFKGNKDRLTDRRQPENGRPVCIVYL